MGGPVLTSHTFTTTTHSPPTPSLRRLAASVSCGGHDAASCLECPQGHGEAWCNGDCTWEGGSCQLLQACVDNPLYKDKYGKDCQSNADDMKAGNYKCSQIYDKYNHQGYTKEDEADVIRNCPATCGMCDQKAP